MASSYTLSLHVFLALCRVTEDLRHIIDNLKCISEPKGNCWFACYRHVTYLNNPLVLLLLLLRCAVKYVVQNTVCTVKLQVYYLSPDTRRDCREAVFNRGGSLPDPMAWWSSPCTPGNCAASISCPLQYLDSNNKSCVDTCGLPWSCLVSAAVHSLLALETSAKENTWILCIQFDISFSAVHDLPNDCRWFSGGPVVGNDATVDNVCYNDFLHFSVAAKSRCNHESGWQSSANAQGKDKFGRWFHACWTWSYMDWL